MRWGPTLFLLLCTITVSCGGPAGPFDTDGDGEVDAEDCAPADPSIHTGAPEVVDGLDNNCDELIDEGTEASDDDGDGACEGHDYGDGLTCIDGSQPGDCDDTNQGLNINDVDGDEQTTCGGDCDDNNPARLLGAAEVCDGLDNDCDGELALTEQDTDGDGASPCDGDCDDTDASLTPADQDGDGFSLCDGDCDDDDASLTPQDSDADGWSSCLGDCDDLSPAVHPEQAEACDLVFDANCDADDDLAGDGVDADGDSDPACSDCDDDDATFSFIDVDGDGFTSCGEPVDCNDLVAGIAPGLIDLAGDGVDANCDGIDGIDSDDDGWAGIDSGGLDCDDNDPAMTPADTDGDGSSLCDGDCDDLDGTVEDLDVDGDGVTTCDGDCDDNDPARHPNAAEACDLVDDSDCDASNDPAGDGVDDDGDGDPACSDCDDASALVHTLDDDGDGYTSCVDDCNDLVATIRPGADDPWNDTIDSNCDGLDGIDGDQDGYAGNASAPFTDCDDTDDALNLDDTDGDGSTTCDGDCDDADASVEALDGDGDGFTTCGLAAGVDAEDDCDDAEPTVFPGADEICDIFDTDCDPSTTLPGDAADTDGDGWPPCAECDDNNSGTWPGAPEICDGQDNDCDGVLMVHGPDGEIDNDGDGYTDCGGDCDDFDATISPLAIDDCDGQDTNCNGIVDDLGDSDGDGWCAGDCDDTDSTVFPGQWEDPLDGLDLDCDGGDATGLGWAHVIVQGYGTDQAMGEALAGGGDIDGDAWPDVLIGAPSDDYWSTEPASACLFRGLDLLAGGTFALDDAWACFLVGDDGGQAVAFVPDVDGDGLDEVALGAPEAAFDWGVAYLFFSSTFAAGGNFDASHVDFSTSYQAGGGLAGSALAAGDVDNDGLGDLLVGVQYHGASYLFLGTTLAAGGSPLIYDADIVFSAGIGDPALAIGDFDGDGWDDVAIGASRWDGDRGRVSLFYGYPLEPGAWSTADADVVITGASAGDKAGYSVSFLGDVDGDAFGELAIGASGFGGTYQGAAYVVSSADLLVQGEYSLAAAWSRIEGTLAYGGFGYALTGPGDMDGDGLADLLVGQYNGTASVAGDGGAWLFEASTLAGGGTFSPADADQVLAGEEAGSFSGWAVYGAGDLDGDGAPDLLVGAPGWGLYGYGRAYLVLNPL